MLRTSMKTSHKHLRSLRKIVRACSQPLRQLHPLTASLLLAFAFSVSGITVNAQSSAASSDKYCAKYSVNSEKVACADGWDGYDCEGYLESHDQNHKDICTSAAAARANGGGADNGNGQTGGDSGNADDDEDQGSDTPAPGDSGSDEQGGKQLDKFIDELHQANERMAIVKAPTDPGLIPDNNYGQYVNGAGKLQPIRVSKAAGDNTPAIIFFNGGGWHTDDGSGDKVAPKANERGYSTFVATYRLGSSGIYYMFEDVMRAVRHVRNNAAMYGIDPARVAVWGDSAGGSLAMRVAGSGKSGARAAVGWSAPTNAFTAIFHSPQSFAIGMDHSTCAPTDLNGAASVADILNGGDGAVVNDGGVGNNNFSGDGGSLGTVTAVLEVAQQARTTGQSIESASKAMEEGGDQASENVRRLATAKVIECMDNFSSASPALFASALSPPTFLAGYERDPLIHPGQAYEMRDKLRSLGIASDALILPGEKHLGYEEEMVAPSLDFLDRYLHP